MVEALVVVLVLAVLAGLAVPGFSGLLFNQQLVSYAATLHTALHYARSEAIKRGQRVVLCKSSDGVVCTTTGGWDQGWLVFADFNNTAQIDGTETRLRVSPSLPSGFALRGNIQIADYVSYTPHGVARRTSGAFQAGTFTLCKRSATELEARQIVISISGRPRVAAVTLASCA